MIAVLAVLFLRSSLWRHEATFGRLAGSPR